MAGIKRYSIEKQKVELGSKSVANIFGRLLAKFKNSHIDEKDGIRFEWADSWLHVRPSNTEPVMRVIAEAPTQKEARSLCSKVMQEV